MKLCVLWTSTCECYRCLLVLFTESQCMLCTALLRTTLLLPSSPVFEISSMLIPNSSPSPSPPFFLTSSQKSTNQSTVHPQPPSSHPSHPAAQQGNSRVHTRHLQRAQVATSRSAVFGAALGFVVASAVAVVAVVVKEPVALADTPLAAVIADTTGFATLQVVRGARWGFVGVELGCTFGGSAVAAGAAR